MRHLNRRRVRNGGTISAWIRAGGLAVAFWSGAGATAQPPDAPLDTLWSLNQGPILTRLAVSPDSTLIATNEGWSVDLRRTADGSIVRSLPHAADANAVAFSVDGAMIATSADDATVHVWRAADGAQLHVLEQARVRTLAFSRDGGTLFAGGGINEANADYRVWQWDVGNHTVAAYYMGNQAAVYSIAVSPDGSTLVSGGADGFVRLWSTGTQALIDSIQYSYQVYAVAISANGQRLATAPGLASQLLRLPGLEVIDTQGVTGLHACSDVAFSANNVIWLVADTASRLFIDGAGGGGAGRWATPTTPAAVLQARVSPNYRWIIYGCLDGTLELARNPFFTCRADWDQNGWVEPADVAAFVATWYRGHLDGTLAGDFDRDGAVQPADVAAFTQAWIAALSRPCTGAGDQ